SWPGTSRQVPGQPVEHLGVRELAAGGLAVEVSALPLGEFDDLLLAWEQVIRLPRLAGEKLLVARVPDQHRGGDLPGHVADLVLPYLGEQAEGVGHPVRLAPE